MASWGELIVARGYVFLEGVQDVHADKAVVSYAVRFLSFRTFNPIPFSDVNSANRSNRPMRKTQIYCARRGFEQTPRSAAVVAVWRREETRWVRSGMD